MLELLVAAAAAASAAGSPKASAWVVPWDAADLGAEASCLEELNPFAFAFDRRDRVVPVDEAFLRRLAAARKKGRLFIPAVVNDVLGDDRIVALKSPELLRRLLDTPEARTRHIDELYRLAEPYDGIELDYERIPRDLWDDYSKFIEQLGARLRARHKRLAVDLETGPLYQARLRFVAQSHWPRLAAAADRLKLMAYYETGPWSLKPGAGNSREWVVDAARRALQFVPANRLAIALSLAGSDWQLPFPGAPVGGQVRRLHYRQVLDLIEKSSAAVQWDEAAATPYFRYVDSTGQHELWFENEKSLAAKIAALREAGVSRVALWYLGRRRPPLPDLGLCSE